MKYNQVEENFKKDKNYAPYCLACATMWRMQHTETGWKCRSCGAIHDSPTKISKLKGDTDEN